MDQPYQLNSILGVDVFLLREIDDVVALGVRVDRVAKRFDGYGSSALVGRCSPTVCVNRRHWHD
jgi:hypothetical protein